MMKDLNNFKLWRMFRGGYWTNLMHGEFNWCKIRTEQYFWLKMLEDFDELPYHVEIEEYK